MHFKTIKTAADLPIKGVELVKIDNTLNEVIIAGRVHIRYVNYGGLQVLIEAPGETAKRYRVTAKLSGFPDAVEYHENSYTADERVSHFKEAGAEVSKDFVDVLITDAGAVVEGDAAPVAPDFEEVPF